ncbi:unnamed protein product [Closterium sp. NIES-64]|nr:unnamed protein product [Closterium sp. NIES-64]
MGPMGPVMVNPQMYAAYMQNMQHMHAAQAAAAGAAQKPGASAAADGASEGVRQQQVRQQLEEALTRLRVLFQVPCLALLLAQSPEVLQEEEPEEEVKEEESKQEGEASAAAESVAAAEAVAAAPGAAAGSSLEADAEEDDDFGDFSSVPSSTAAPTASAESAASTEPAAFAAAPVASAAAVPAGVSAATAGTGTAEEDDEWGDFSDSFAPAPAAPATQANLPQADASHTLASTAPAPGTAAGTGAAGAAAAGGGGGAGGAGAGGRLEGGRLGQTFSTGAGAFGHGVCGWVGQRGGGRGGVGGSLSGESGEGWEEQGDGVAGGTGLSFAAVDSGGSSTGPGSRPRAAIVGAQLGEGVFTASITAALESVLQPTVIRLPNEASQKRWEETLQELAEGAESVARNEFGRLSGELVREGRMEEAYACRLHAAAVQLLPDCQGQYSMALGDGRVEAAAAVREDIKLLPDCQGQYSMALGMGAWSLPSDCQGQYSMALGDGRVEAAAAVREHIKPSSSGRGGGRGGTQQRLQCHQASTQQRLQCLQASTQQRLQCLQASTQIKTVATKTATEGGEATTTTEGGRQAQKAARQPLKAVWLGMTPDLKGLRAVSQRQRTAVQSHWKLKPHLRASRGGTWRLCAAGAAAATGDSKPGRDLVSLRWDERSVGEMGELLGRSKGDARAAAFDGEFKQEDICDLVSADGGQRTGWGTGVLMVSRGLGGALVVGHWWWDELSVGEMGELLGWSRGDARAAAFEGDRLKRGDARVAVFNRQFLGVPMSPHAKLLCCPGSHSSVPVHPRAVVCLNLCLLFPQPSPDCRPGPHSSTAGAPKGRLLVQHSLSSSAAEAASFVRLWGAVAARCADVLEAAVGVKEKAAADGAATLSALLDAPKDVLEAAVGMKEKAAADGAATLSALLDASKAVGVREKAAADGAGTLSALLDTPKARDYFAAITQTYGVLVVIAACAQLHRPWLSVRLGTGSAGPPSGSGESGSLAGRGSGEGEQGGGDGEGDILWAHLLRGQAAWQNGGLEAVANEVLPRVMVPLSWSDVEKVLEGAELAAVQRAAELALEGRQRHMGLVGGSGTLLQLESHFGGRHLLRTSHVDSNVTWGTLLCVLTQLPIFAFTCKSLSPISFPSLFEATWGKASCTSPMVTQMSPLGLLCALARLPIFALTSVAAVEWYGHRYLLPVANFWANHISNASPLMLVAS